MATHDPEGQEIRSQCPDRMSALFRLASLKVLLHPVFSARPLPRRTDHPHLRDMSALPPAFQKIVDSLSAGRVNLVTACEPTSTDLRFACSAHTSRYRCLVLLGTAGSPSAGVQICLAKQTFADQSFLSTEVSLLCLLELDCS